ncbi:restin homolog [Anopheles bellator]|uniref:restin homolog n=1 Tax=Anopheles bellator TaxID=139047 RepID=UPI00264948A8|nr:restin homolog [Anopheles bellator]
MEINSELIRKRAEVALEIAKDLLVDDDDNDDDGGDIDEEEYCCGDNDELEEESKETDRDSGMKTNAKDEKTENYKHKGSRAKKGWLNTVAGVIMRPFGSKLKWNINFNLDVQASNKNSQTKGNSKRNAGASSSTVSQQPTSADATVIKNLKAENRRLGKLADTFLNECIQLKTKASELVEAKEQLLSSRLERERFEKEISELKRCRESLMAEHAAESERHHVTVAQLEKKVQDTCAQLADMTKKCDELCRVGQGKDKELDTLTKQSEAIAQELQQTTEKYQIRFDNLTENLSKMEIEKVEITKRNALIVAEISHNLEQMERGKKEAESKIVAMNNKLGELQNEKYETQNDLEMCRAQMREMQRVVAVLESTQSVTTTSENNKNGLYTCPLCSEQFESLATMQLHAEDCG